MMPLKISAKNYVVWNDEGNISGDIQKDVVVTRYFSIGEPWIIRGHLMNG